MSSSHLFPTPMDLLLAFLLTLPLLFLLRLRRTSGGLVTDWPIIGMIPSFLYNLHRIHDYMVDVLRSSGATTIVTGIWLLSSDCVLTADPANINHIFTSNFHNYPKGPAFAEIFDVLGSGIFNSDHDSWKHQRKLAHGFMAQQTFRTFVLETSRLKVETGILALLSRASDFGDAIDLQDVFLRFTFDTTCILVMGVDPGCLSPDMGSVPFADSMDDAEEVILVRHVMPMSCWKLLRWLRVGEERRLEAAKATIEEFIMREISKRKSTEVLPSADLLSSYLSSSSDVSSSEFLRDTAVNLLLAGRDTTASGLSWFFFLISTHPRAQEKVLLELRKARRQTGTDGLTVFEVESLLPLVYLHAALLETLRLYPPVPFEHKRAREEDVLPSGHRVEKEMEVLVSLYAMGRMEGVWGKDCEEFRPERWINDKGRLRYEPSYKFLTFNSGPRTCLGKDMALSQMKVAVATILWNFEVEVLEAAKVRPKVSIILQIAGEGLKVRIRKRTSE